MTVPLFHLSLYHFVFSQQFFLYSNVTHSIISALLCLFRYSVAASLVHPDNYCITVSFACLYILHLLLSAGKALFAFHVLVSTICSCTTITDATFFVSILHCSHLLLSSYSFSYTSPYIFTFLCSSLIYNFMTFPSVTILVSSHFTIFPLNLSYYTFFAIIKLFSLLRLLFAFFFELFHYSFFLARCFSPMFSSVYLISCSCY